MNFYEQIFSRGRATGEGMTHFERLFAAKFGGSLPPEVREYTGAVPVTITADGTPLLDYLIIGNTVQSGTPTPDNPIMPQGTGDRTGNLFDSNPYKIGYAISNLGEETQNSYFNIYTAKVSAGTQYCLSFVYPESARYRMVRIHEYSGGIWQSQLIAQNCELFPLSFTTSDNIDEVRISIINTTSNHMLNLGSTPLQYEPYGYKIPISSANTTTPVYLGEVESTRRIKKLVLTGEESGAMMVDDTNHIFALRGIFNSEPELLQVGGVCTHYKYNNAISSLVANMQNGDFVLNKIVGDYSFTIKDNSFNAATGFTTYLAQQYANGTPVTIWYVLATPTTAIVNEPLRKIGDYADTVSMEQAGVQIPTNNGSTTIDVETTLKPSEVYIKYMG